MAQQSAANRTGSLGRRAPPVAAPQVMVRLVGALLALAVAAVHMANQGGVTALASPDWLGWSFRLIEIRRRTDRDHPAAAPAAVARLRAIHRLYRLMAKLINRHNKSVTPPAKPLPHARLHDLRHLHATTLFRGSPRPRGR